MHLQLQWDFRYIKFTTDCLQYATPTPFTKSQPAMDTFQLVSGSNRDNVDIIFLP